VESVFPLFSVNSIDIDFLTLSRLMTCAFLSIFALGGNSGRRATQFNLDAHQGSATVTKLTIQNQEAGYACLAGKDRLECLPSRV
jgi:hypothetical protein